MKVTLKHAGRWLRFSRPEKTWVANQITEIQPLMKEAEASGLFLAGFLSYEAAPAFDPALKTRDSTDFPLMALGGFRAPEIVEEHAPMKRSEYRIGALSASISAERYRADIARIKERIAEGATYQVNHTYRLSAEFSGDPWAFFLALVSGQKTEHAAFVEMDDFAICSASPELFFSVADGEVVSRPMKGTAPRGRTLSEDWRNAEALRASEKDRAENIMIVDMIRNDIGRIAETGSVDTISAFDVEKYPTVWQMTSTVRGRVERLSLTRLFSALFPCASITGAPKAKTMEIIRELETSPRKIYTGAIGFATPSGEASFNVAIRTALIQDGMLEFGVGGGVVWDSKAESEFEETRTKARVLTQPRPDFRLLETMLVEADGTVYLLEEHLRRLGRSAAYFDVPLELNEALAALEAAAIAGKPRKLRLLVSRDGGFEVESHALAAEESAEAKVALAREAVDANDVFLYHKTTNRAVYETARSDFPNHDDVILHNERGEVTESVFANVLVRRGEEWITPPLECGLLAGTLRERLLRGGDIREDVVTIEELKNAEEIALINSVRKWRRARLEV